MAMKKAEGVILRSKAKWVEKKTINISWVLKSETITPNILRNLLIQSQQKLQALQVYWKKRERFITSYTPQKI